jgi:hypothetical protein
MEMVINDYVAPNITSENWKCRYSALLALGAIIEGPTKLKF